MSAEPRIIRTEKRDGPGRYPSEIAWTEDGRWTIPNLPLGAWTDRVASPTESEDHQRITGGRITTDELHWSIIGHAQEKGWRPDPIQAALIHRCSSLLDVNSPAKGTARLTDPQTASDFARIARDSVDWLNTNVAPPGRRFVLEDALYLIEG